MSVCVCVCVCVCGVCVYVHACTFSHVQLFVILWTIACWASLSVEFSRQEYWSGVTFPIPGDHLDPRIEPVSLASPALASRFFTLNHL